MKLKKLLFSTILGSVALFASFPTENLCTTQTNISTRECGALESLWDATNGPNWANDTWGNDVNLSTWVGLSLGNDYVYKIDISLDKNVSGSIPLQLKDLTQLRWLIMVGNNLNGSFPSVLALMPNIEVISIRDNNLSGRLIELTGLNNLTDLYIDTNNFEGPIPESYALLESLEKLDLDHNKLSGKVPYLGLYNSETLFGIDLRYNNFSFKDLEPNISGLLVPTSTGSPRAVYAPQYFNDYRTIYFENKITISSLLPDNTPAKGGHDSYDWRYYTNNYEDEHILNVDAYTYVKENATEADAGIYIYRVTNPLITDPYSPKGPYPVAVRNLYFSNTAINLVYNHTLVISNITPQTSVVARREYTYTFTVSDLDEDPIRLKTTNLPSWLDINNDESVYTLSGTPDTNDTGAFDINITIVDLDSERNNAEKIPVNINFTLNVNPSDDSIPTGFTVSADGVYTHTDTNNTLSGEGSIEIVNDGLELTQSCVNNKMAFISLDSNGLLSTGFKDCTTDERSETFTTELPNNTKASIVTNNNEKMILIELPLDDDMTLGGN